MARTRTHDRNQKPFTMPDTETKPVKSLRGVPPQSQQDAQIMGDENKRTFAANLIDNLIESYRMPKVQSNRELEERAINYLRMCSEKRIPPTWEGLALYCGYARSTLWDMMAGRHKGFTDETESGGATSAIVKRLRELFATFDGTMAITGGINPVSYIFRSSNYYGLVQKQTVAVEPQSDLLRPPATPDEIAKNLPELDGGLIDLLESSNE